VKRFNPTLLVSIFAIVVLAIVFFRVFPVYKTSRYVPLAITICDFYKATRHLPSNLEELEKWVIQNRGKNTSFNFVNIELKQDLHLIRFLKSQENFVIIRGHPNESDVVNNIVRDFVRSQLPE
jgi:hypothetical protein